MPIKYCTGGTTLRQDWRALFQLIPRSVLGVAPRRDPWHIFGGHARGHADYGSGYTPFSAICFRLTLKKGPL